MPSCVACVSFTTAFLQQHLSIICALCSVYTCFQNGRHFSFLLFTCKLAIVVSFVNSKFKGTFSFAPGFSSAKIEIQPNEIKMEERIIRMIEWHATSNPRRLVLYSRWTDTSQWKELSRYCTSSISYLRSRPVHLNATSVQRK